MNPGSPLYSGYQYATQIPDPPFPTFVRRYWHRDHGRNYHSSKILFMNTETEESCLSLDKLENLE